MPDSLIIEIILNRLGDRKDDFLLPPPVFLTMRGEFLGFNLEAGWLTTRFPILVDFLNPYGTLQGGMIAAAIDNTIGPLSMLVAPPNVTRRLEIKYSRPVTLEMEYITVEGKLISREGHALKFKAEVRDHAGVLLARARADHWIVDEAGKELP